MVKMLAFIITKCRNFDNLKKKSVFTTCNGNEHPWRAGQSDTILKGAKQVWFNLGLWSQMRWLDCDKITMPDIPYWGSPYDLCCQTKTKLWITVKNVLHNKFKHFLKYKLYIFKYTKAECPLNNILLYKPIFKTVDKEYFYMNYMVTWRTHYQTFDTRVVWVHWG